MPWRSSTKELAAHIASYSEHLFPSLLARGYCQLNHRNLRISMTIAGKLKSRLYGRFQPSNLLPILNSLTHMFAVAVSVS